MSNYKVNINIWKSDIYKQGFFYTTFQIMVAFLHKMMLSQMNFDQIKY